MQIHALTQIWIIKKELPSFALEYFVNFETQLRGFLCCELFIFYKVSCQPWAAKKPSRSTMEYHGQ